VDEHSADHRDDAPDRLAIDNIRGYPLNDHWPDNAIAAGARVKVLRDPVWDGPLRQEFLGVVSSRAAPEAVESPIAHLGELAYWVTFDEPQFDSSGDGPYRKALIWARYLQPVGSEQ